MNQEVAPVSLVPTGISKATEEELKALEGVEGAGLSDSVEDRGTPLLYIAQKQTPQCEERDAKYIAGLKAGMVFNNLTGKFYDAEKTGFLFLPCFMRVVYSEWTPRDQGGGFHGEYPRNVDLNKLGAKQFVGKKGKARRDIFILPNGNELKLTPKYYGVMAADWTPIIVPMGSTNLGASQRLQALIEAQKIEVGGGRITVKPGYWNLYNIKTTYETNEEGSWFQYSPVLHSENTNAALKDFCRQFALICARGTVKEAAPQSETGGAPNDADIPI